MASTVTPRNQLPTRKPAEKLQQEKKELYSRARPTLLKHFIGRVNKPTQQMIIGHDQSIGVKTRDQILGSNQVNV